MRNVHEVPNDQMDFLLAMHFTDSMERAVWSDAMRTKIEWLRQSRGPPPLPAWPPAQAPAPLTTFLGGNRSRVS